MNEIGHLIDEEFAEVFDDAYLSDERFLANRKKHVSSILNSDLYRLVHQLEPFKLGMVQFSSESRLPSALPSPETHAVGTLARISPSPEIVALRN